MKTNTTKHLIFVSLISLFVCAKASTINRNGINFKNSIDYYSMPIDDPNIQFSVLKNDWDIRLHVSFIGNEGATGVLKVFNASNNLVNQFDISLVSPPSYFEISLPEWASGTYSVELTTSSGVHTSHFTIL